MPVNFAQLQDVGYGLLNFTWVPSRKFSPEDFNATLKKVIDGSKATSADPLLLNGGEFYGVPDRHESLSLLGNFFKAHPDYADRVYISIKGGVDDHWGPDSSPERLAATFEAIDKYLKPLYEARRELPKHLDMFTLARIGDVPIEDVMKVFDEKIASCAFSALCLSELSESTLVRALKAGNVGALELEFSLFHREPATNGLFAKCAELGIPVVCYSPLGKGLLAGQTASDLAKDDMRHNFDKFSDPDVMKNNQTLVDKVKDIAKSLDLSPAQVALSWITTLSGSKHDGVQYPDLLPIPGSTNADRQLSNLAVVKLSNETIAEIDEVLKSFKTAGSRYNKQLDEAGYK